jgi:methylmalonyl-CoA carboxyltransferase large subunit
MNTIDLPETRMSEPVPDPPSDSAVPRVTLEQIRAQLANLAERVAGLEKLTPPAPPAAATQPRAAQAPPTDSSVAAAAGISEEELLAISAALAAYLGVHAHIRQVRLIRTAAWAQQGRVTIQASHRLNH